ncbi:2-amino-4-hydroxy-6-hydroxymethyldihydropteridine diphosphokinase [Jannaschia sp. S6380]|uniref:2-amino-4-hydroxy-6- hydroxymethyldihydropteridine diphosphokinase n=1 Tax=Jannaschia sp. S6380 TaxID=2926408 RepID=UPI001FF5CA63|nr:2-amino-4-hydroxy-6-hydroxymethyldihydropteridine diphosphokinase [Jannaschia sp. S6380]MCK0169378.1 2-amino-4-hydroxy-6-hydroxymethyldihydropteridine diphosphokinase [Jannaschia sp. S6380]
MTLHLIALGANSGVSRSANVMALARAVARMPSRVQAISRPYRTPAWPDPSDPDFVNAALALWSPMPPAHLLDRLHRIEALQGRVRPRRWGPRVLDLDLLASGRAVRPNGAVVRAWMSLSPVQQSRKVPKRLILPHPRLAERAFVLLPLAGIAPGWRHPLTGRTVRAMAAALPASARKGVRPIGTLTGVVNRKIRA